MSEKRPYTRERIALAVAAACNAGQRPQVLKLLQTYNIVATDQLTLAMIEPFTDALERITVHTANVAVEFLIGDRVEIQRPPRPWSVGARPNNLRGRVAAYEVRYIVALEPIPASCAFRSPFGTWRAEVLRHVEEQS